MAITFDPFEKIIQLDSYTVSERELWTALVNWSVEGDNLKYGVGMTQLGGVAPVALYIFLSEGWRIRPLAQAGVTTITGNLLTSDNDSPIEQAINAVQVNMETPVKAVAIDAGGSSSSGASVAQVQAIIDNLHNFNPTSQEVTAVGLDAFATSALPKIRAILVDSNELQQNQGNFATADVSALSTFNNATDEVTTNVTSRDASKGLTTSEGIQLTNIDVVTKLIPGLL